jgi:outer membrane receptor protein involved in Fe transport
MLAPQGASADEPAKGAPTQVTPGQSTQDKDATDKDATKDEPSAEPAAESAPPPAAEETAPAPVNGGVEKVIVTATRRETLLQKTPIAITAVGEKQLKAAQVENIEDLVPVVPSLIITNNGNPFAYTARIRGVGTQGDNPGLEAAVGTFIDGVYRNRAGVAMSDLGELERVEVLRGPQGTLFGRNTSAGILNIITKKPVFANKAEAEATIGSYDQYAGRGSANFVLSEDELAARLFFVRHEQEGYVDVNPGRPDFYDGNAKSYYGTRGQMLWQVSPDAEIRFIGDYAERQDQCCSAATVFAGASGGPAGAPAPTVINGLESPFPGKATSNQVDALTAFGNRTTNADTDDWGGSGELNWDIGGAKLTSITALRDWKTAYAQDADFSGADLVYFADDGSNFNKFETFTHETRITGEAGWVNWLFGAYYADEDLTRGSTLTFGSELEEFFGRHRVNNASATALRDAINAFLAVDIVGPMFAGGDGDRYFQNAETFALFTHNVFHLESDLDLIAGLRWTRETKTFDAVYRTDPQAGCAAIEFQHGLDPVPGVIAAFGAGAGAVASLACVPFAREALDVLTATAPHHQESEEDEFSGIATLAWQVDADVNTYATYSRGHKAGGFNLDRAFSDANGSIVSGPVGAQTVRAPDTSFAPEFVDAFEVGLKTTFDDSFFVNTALFYQQFENFQLNTFTGISFIVTSVPEVISQGVEVETFWVTPLRGLTTNFAVQYTDARYGDIGSLSEPGSFIALNPNLFLLADNARLTHSPEWTLTGGADYAFPFIETFTARFHVDARWQSEMNTGSNLDPRKVQDAFAVVGMKFGVYSEGERVGIELFARNLFDERYINTAFDSPFQGSAVCSPTVAGCNVFTNGTSTIDAFLGEPRMIGLTLRMKN